MKRTKSDEIFAERRKELEDSLWDIATTKRLLLFVIRQAVNDFTLLKSDSREFKTAEAMLFDDDYRLAWGDKALSMPEVLEFLDEDTIETFRKAALYGRENKVRVLVSLNATLGKDELKRLDKEEELEPFYREF